MVRSTAISSKKKSIKSVKSTIKDEAPPKYRLLNRNLYSTVRREEFDPKKNPVCDCTPEEGCGAECINRSLMIECAPKCCSSLKPGEEYCKNTTIQTLMACN